MITGLCFIAAGLAIIVATFAFSHINTANSAERGLNHLTLIMGRSCLADYKPLSYRLVYIFLILALALLGSGIYYWGQ